MDLSSRGDSTQDAMREGRTARGRVRRTATWDCVVSGRLLLEGLCISLAKAD
jgi:hypothetical protein